MSPGFIVWRTCHSSVRFCPVSPLFWPPAALPRNRPTHRRRSLPNRNGLTGHSDAAKRVDALADDYWAQFIQTFPLGGLFLGVPESPNDRLGENSLSAVRAWERKEDRWLDQLHQIRARELTGQPEDATYGVLLETLEASRQGRVCRPELLPLSQQAGWQLFLPVVAQLQPLGTAELRAAALARWHGVARYVDTEIADLREGLRLGYTQPQGNAKAVLEQLDDLLKLPPDRSPFAGLAARDSAPGFKDSVVSIVAREILPATRRYRDFLVSEYIPHARVSTELAALPHGAECYRSRVRLYTTVDRDARSIHQLGLQQMAAIEAARLGPSHSGASGPRISPPSMSDSGPTPPSPSGAGRRSSRPRRPPSPGGRRQWPSGSAGFRGETSLWIPASHSRRRAAAPTRTSPALPTASGRGGGG